MAHFFSPPLTFVIWEACGPRSPPRAGWVRSRSQGSVLGLTASSSSFPVRSWGALGLHRAPGESRMASPEVNTQPIRGQGSRRLPGGSAAVGGRSSSRLLPVGDARLALPRTEPSVSLEDGPWRQLQSGWNTELLLVRQPHPFHCFHEPSGFP